MKGHTFRVFFSPLKSVPWWWQIYIFIPWTGCENNTALLFHQWLSEVWYFSWPMPRAGCEIFKNDCALTSKLQRLDLLIAIQMVCIFNRTQTNLWKFHLNVHVLQNAYHVVYSQFFNCKQFWKLKPLIFLFINKYQNTNLLDELKHQHSLHP